MDLELDEGRDRELDAMAEGEGGTARHRPRPLLDRTVPSDRASERHDRAPPLDLVQANDSGRQTCGSNLTVGTFSRTTNLSFRPA